MDEGREMRVQELKERVARGDYEVEERLVADAVIERLRRVRERHDDAKQSQSECSYPDSVAAPGPKSTAGGPATTLPIHVREAAAVLAASLRRALGGMQTQSS